MATMSYRDQLLHPNWQRKRLEMLDAAGWECQNCGDGTTTLHVHHRQYFKDRLAWEYGITELVVLCEPCHSAEHVVMDGFKRLLAQVSPQQAFALLAGFHRPSDFIERELIEEGRQCDAFSFAAGFVAYLVSGLDIGQILQVGELAASLHEDTAEARYWFTHSRGNTFGED